MEGTFLNGGWYGLQINRVTTKKDTMNAIKLVSEKTKKNIEEIPGIKNEIAKTT
jgi:hypothetical protein